MAFQAHMNHFQLKSFNYDDATGKNEPNPI